MERAERCRAMAAIGLVQPTAMALGPGLPLPPPRVLRLAHVAGQKGWCLMGPWLLSVLHGNHRKIAEIVAIVKTVPEPQRLDVLAIAVRALVDSHLLDGYARSTEVS